MRGCAPLQSIPAVKLVESEVPMRPCERSLWAISGRVHDISFCGDLFELYTVPVLISTYDFTPRFAASLPTVTLNW